MKVFKNILVLVLVLFVAQGAFGQKKPKVKNNQRLPPNLSKFYEKPYHFGFYLGYNTSTFKMKNSSDTSYYDGIRSLNSGKAPGFDLGIVADYHFSHNLSLRLTPGLSFQERPLIFVFDAGANSINKVIESTVIEVPLSFKFSINRIQNFATYFTLGGKYSLDMASNEDVNNSTNSLIDVVVKTKKHDYSYTIGGGFDFFLTYFKFGIDLKASFGIPNIFIQDNTMFSSPIESLKTRSLMISLTFEG